MRQLQAIALGALLSLAALPAFANCGNGGDNGQGCVPAPLAGVGLPALAVGAIGYFVYRIRQRSK